MYKRILVPIAFDHQGDSDAALKLAQLLRDADGTIALLSVVEAIPGYAETYLPTDARERHISETVQRLGDMAQRIGGTVETQVAVGNPGTEILDFAEQTKCDCVVMLSHKPGLEDYLLGSTAARVVRHAPCSVHVIR